MKAEASGVSLLLDGDSRTSLWNAVTTFIESHLQSIERLPVSPSLTVADARRIAESFTFEQPLVAEEAFLRIASELVQGQVHTSHPQYFGLFNPAPTTMSIAADALVAALNPQLAAWSHSPLAVEIERHLVRSIAARFGFALDQADGVLTSGGAEANQTALLAALAYRWPTVAADGLRSLSEVPVFYVSSEGHHSFLKAARTVGLGANALRQASVEEDLRIAVRTLRATIRRDRDGGYAPFLLVATAGTTGAGVVDALPELARVAQEEGLWFHVDAAWGGAAAFVPELRAVLDGIELADSITFDPHKWLSVSMGAGMFLTRYPDLLGRLFAIQTSYMPKEGNRLAITDPFAHSLQWSRRFIGLKLFLSLAVAGWDGYAAVIGHQAQMGDLLRKRLAEEHWNIVNSTPLPLICFCDPKTEDEDGACQRIADRVVASGEAWLSTVQLRPDKRPALRACITNYRTEPRHIEALVAALNRARSY